MSHVIAIGAGVLLVAVTFGGFIWSFFKPTPKGDSFSDVFTLQPPDHSGDGDHGG
jgi:hypothetical protein